MPVRLALRFYPNSEPVSQPLTLVFSTLTIGLYGSVMGEINFRKLFNTFQDTGHENG